MKRKFSRRYQALLLTYLKQRPGARLQPARGMGEQRRIACGGEQAGMGLGGESQHAGDRDVGVADAIPEPVKRGNGSTLGFQRIEHAADLGFAARDPDF